MWTTIHDLADPLTGERRSIRWRTGGGVCLAPSFPAGEGREIDGAGLWLLPALYDADAHMPHLEFGVRRSDILRALTGGVAQMNVAVRWQLARTMDVAAIAEELARHRLPRIIPLLSVSPNAESEGFAAWLGAHRPALSERFLNVVKLYSNDPFLHRNLDALWAAGMTPMVWNADEASLADLVDRAGDRPLHLRHATSAGMVATMRRATGATLQTSPHFLMPIAEAKRRALVVLPPLLPAEAGRSLAEVFLDQVDLLASDHNAPFYRGAPVTPGLQTQQQFLPALLTLAEMFDWPLAAVLAKATTRPAAVFGVAAPGAFLVVDPEHREPVGNWPGQSPDRAPFEGLTLRGRVLAVAAEDGVELV